MQLEHSFTVPSSVAVTWAAFNDLERIAPCFPGATLASVDGDDFTGACKVKLGPISLQYSGSGTFVERDASAQRAVIKALGKDRRGNGTAAATVTAQLSADGSGTLVNVLTDLSITGKPAQFGRGVMQDVSDKLLGQFVSCLESMLAAPEEAPLAPPEPGSAEAPAAEPRVVTAPPATPTSGAELNLLGAAAPVLLKRYGPPLVIVMLLLGVVRRLVRRR